MEENWDSWSTLIRSTLISSKNPLTPYEINRDIKKIDGRSIPYRYMNYSSLEEMLKDISGLKMFQLNGKTVVKAIANEKTVHIQNMVKCQKSGKKRTLPYVSNTCYMNKQHITHQESRNSRKVSNVPIDRYDNQENICNFSLKSKAKFIPKETSTPILKRPLQAPQHVLSVRKFNLPESQQSSYQQQIVPPIWDLPLQAPQHVSSVPNFNLPESQQSSYQQKIGPPIWDLPLQAPQHVLPVPNFNLPQSQQSLYQQKIGPPIWYLPLQAPQHVSSLPNFNLQKSQQPLYQQQTSTDPRITLNCYCQSEKLPNPEYKDIPRKGEIFYSSVMVNLKKYNSYPHEARTKDDAEKLAAEVALKELLKDNKKSIIITSDHDLIVNRIVHEVNNYPNGLFQSRVVELYTAKYSESLPSNWLKQVEGFVNIDVGVSNLIILSPANYNANLKSQPIIIRKPENLKLNNVEKFWLQVYAVYNITSIWGVIVDGNHSGKIIELALEMKMHYDIEEPKVLPAIPGDYYAVLNSDWHRVRCTRVDEKSQTATVFFIDRGDEDVISTSRLRELHQRFCRLPAQAVRLSLAGLEIFEDCEMVKTLLEKKLVDKSVYVIIERNGDSFKDVKYAGALSAKLSIEQDGEEINFNYSVRNEFFNQIFDPQAFLRPTDSHEKNSYEVHISYADKNAIYIQLKSEGLKYLKKLIDNFAKKNLVSSTPLSIDPTKVYMAKILNEWFRVRIVKVEEDTVQVFCIDVGNTSTVKKNNLVLLDDLSEILSMYPAQAAQVRLFKVSPLKNKEKMVNSLRHLAPKADVFQMKLVGHVDVPIVELYKKTENNYQAASLNVTLAIELEITSKENSISSPRKRNDRLLMDARNDFPLKAPVIPSIGSHFPVHVIMAAHPGNFKIQPLKSLSELETLTEELSRYYESNSGSFTCSSVKVGNMYAAKDKSSRWCRVYVSTIISKSLCVIYFCDYGNYNLISMDQLLPLQHQFFDLPYQAVRATLYGLTPKSKGDWTEKDFYRLHELIMNKNFYSIIKSCEVEAGETILGLELIDTRDNSKVINIAEVLVNEKRADRLTK